jgi:hypothetical protein
MAGQRASRPLVGRAAANRRKGKSGNADDLLETANGCRDGPCRCMGHRGPWRLPRRHCHVETAHDTCSGLGATWRSGDAADCKSAHPGSIPGVASQGALVTSEVLACLREIRHQGLVRRSSIVLALRSVRLLFSNRYATRTSSRIGRPMGRTVGLGAEARIRLLRPRE